MRTQSYNPDTDEKRHLISIWYCYGCHRFFIQQGQQMYDECDDKGILLNSSHPCPYCGNEHTGERSSVLDTTAHIEAKMYLKDGNTSPFWLKTLN